MIKILNIFISFTLIVLQCNSQTNEVTPSLTFANVSNLLSQGSTGGQEIRLFNTIGGGGLGATIGGGGIGSLQTGLSNGINVGLVNNAIGGLQTNSILGNQYANLGSLGLVGTGVGLNTTFNTSAQTQNNLVTTIIPTQLQITPITITTTTTTNTPLVSSSPIIPTTIVSLNVRDINGQIININSYNSRRTTLALIQKYDINRLNMYNSESLSYQTTIRDTLNVGEVLNENQYLRSSNKAYYLILQGDGNLVLYCSRVLISRNIIWETKTSEKGTTGLRKFTIQNNGNLILYSNSIEQKLWDSRTSSSHSPFKLVVQDDGNIVLYGAGNRAIWASNTVRR